MVFYKQHTAFRVINLSYKILKLTSNEQNLQKLANRYDAGICPDNRVI